MSLKILKTVWGEQLTDKPLQEYPRPQFQRESYVNLNGKWDYAFTDSSDFPQSYDGKILVPFSPESVLSGVDRILQPGQYLFYRTVFTLNKTFNKGLVLLHFGAADFFADVYVNGVHCSRHAGGYNAFTADITAALREKDNELVVRILDLTDTSYHTVGKQSTNRHGMWYTPQSGIWQTVWLESVPAEYMESADIIPLFDEAAVKIRIYKNFDEPITVAVLDGDKEIAKADGGEEYITVRFPEGKFTAWTPEEPFLYGLKFISRRDIVSSYFGMRKFGTEKFGKYVRLTLNNKPYFHNGLLDQGYWSDGLYTAPSDAALIYDINEMKSLGFNMLRKHIKVEPMRWYYHCDRLGMLVWQDMPSGGRFQNHFVTSYLPFIGIDKLDDTKYGRFSRTDKEGREEYMRELDEMVSQLFNCVSIAVWVPFNEGWGQFDSVRVSRFLTERDSSRSVDHASGWHDQGAGHFNSQHVYFKKVRLNKDDKRAVVLSEFGGYSYKDAAHSFNPDYTYSYKEFKDRLSFNAALKKLFVRDVIKQIGRGLSATVYTQVSDVEDEVNGLLSYDRKILKVDAEMLQELNAQIKI